jgi:hypothetical protein
MTDTLESSQTWRYQTTYAYDTGPVNIHGSIQNLKISILPMNGYEYIEIPIGVSPHTLLESVWHAALSWVVGFIIGDIFPLFCFHKFAVLRWLTWENSETVKSFVLNLGKPQKKTPNVETSFW